MALLLSELRADRDRMADELKATESQRMALEEQLDSAAGGLEQLRAAADRALVLAREIAEMCPETVTPTRGMTRMQFRQLERVNKELWILLSLFVIALLLNYVFASQRMVLGFYVLPTLGSAYLYGKRHATLTAFASVLMVVLLLMYGDAFYPRA